MGHDIVRLTNVDDQFYPLLGPFLSRRAVVTELGGPIWDEDDKVWFVRMGSTGEALGFLAAVPRGKGAAHICSGYVLPERRRQGIHTALLSTVTAWLAERRFTQITATVTPAACAAYDQQGFKPSGQRGRYRTYSLELKRDE